MFTLYEVCHVIYLKDSWWLTGCFTERKNVSSGKDILERNSPSECLGLDICHEESDPQLTLKSSLTMLRFTAMLYVQVVSLNGLSSLSTKQEHSSGFTALKSAIHRKLWPSTKPLLDCVREFKAVTTNI